jgi:uncharacterized protein Smg (DUF494 family)
MGERIMEIVIFLVQMLQENEGKLGDLKELFVDLRKLGFTENEINSAYSWVFEEILPLSESYFKANKANGSYNRVLNEVERSSFTPQGLGTLLQMRNLGILSEELQEAVIDRVVLLGKQKADSEMVRILASALVFNNFSSSSPHFDLDWLKEDEEETIN